MPLDGNAYRFLPAGLSDAVTEDFGFPGCCTALTNLIPDPTNKNLWQSRPAAVQLAVLPTPTFAANAVISTFIVVGDYVYGMAQGGAAFAGLDIPFCYNLATNSFVTISGFTASNCPSSQPTTGAWTPPDMTVVGTRVTIVHPGYDGVTHFVGWINISNLASPSYTSGNTATNGLPAVPVAVAQFSQRAYYMINAVGSGQPGVYASDSLDPTTRTNNTYTITFGDSVPLTGFGYVGLQSPLTGGITSALLVFKGTQNIYQITGDFSSTVSVFPLTIPTGTRASNTIAVTPQGCAFMSPEGIRFVDAQGHVSPPLGANGQGVTKPFLNALTPSRAVLASTGSVMRVTVQNAAAPGSPFQEYWYDFNAQVWSGPHPFTASIIQPYKNTFIVAPIAVPGTLWQSDVQQSPTSVYTENGLPMSYTFQTAIFGDGGALNRININESFLRVAAYAAMVSPIAQIIDQNGSALNNTTLSAGSVGYYWGVNNWGTHVWLGNLNNLIQNPLFWTSPVVVNEAGFRLTGISGQGFSIGDLAARIEPLGYMPNNMTPTSTSGTGVSSNLTVAPLQLRGAFTLNANQTTTLVTVPGMTATSSVNWRAASLDAAAMESGMYTRPQDIGNGFFVVNHGSSPNTDNTFAYTVEI